MYDNRKEKSVYIYVSASALNWIFTMCMCVRE